MLKRYCFSILVVLPLLLSAQHTEIGLFAGTSNYQGDLSPTNLNTSLSRTHASFGAFGRYNLNNYLALRLGLTYGKISGDDDDNGSPRNLDFTSALLDVNLTGEFNILGYQPYALEKVFTPYVFVGIGFVHFNPRTQVDGEWIELQPLGTEGQGTTQYGAKYSLFQVVIPFGGGLKYAINDSWNLGARIGIRKTFTDYLDDVSTVYPGSEFLIANNGELSAALSNRTGEEFPADTQRGNSESLDWYVFMGISVSYNFMDNGLVGSRSRSRRGNGCYDNF